MSKDENKPADAAARSGAGEGLGTNSEIGRKLKQYYDGLVSDQVPDKFMDLLAKLDSAEERSTSKAKG